MRSVIEVIHEKIVREYGALPEENAYGRLVINPYEDKSHYPWNFDFSPRTEDERIAAQERSDIFYKDVIDAVIAERFVDGKCAPFDKVHLTTINKCNGQCSFCSISHDRTQPLLRMDETTFLQIVSGLKGMGFNGKISLHGVNEPLLDQRLSEWCAVLKRELPGCRLQLLTNGTLLDEKAYTSLIGNLDLMDIHIYDDMLVMPDNIRNLVDFISGDASLYSKTQIFLRRRNELLAQKGYGNCGRSRLSHIESACIMPFTALSISPLGEVSYCASDYAFKGIMGNVNDNTLLEIWNSPAFCAYRTQMKKGRKYTDYCSICDFF